jgi:CelD/BcsL family acetyltransferase involved in cellulose biosynthesis
MQNVFATREYLMAYRRHFGARKSWHRLRTPGATAFLQERGRSARRLEWWGAGIHDIGGPLLSGSSEYDAGALWARIEAQAAQCDGARLAQVEAGEPLVACARAAGWDIAPAEVCPVLELPASFDEWVKSLGKNAREQARRYPKRLEKNFAVEYELAHDEASTSRALDDLFSLHGRRWRSRGQTGVLATPRRQAFHREVCAEFLKRDWLRLWTLRLDGRPACVLLFYYFGGRLWFFIGGFEIELQKWSVGTCLFARAIGAAIEEGAHEIDFLRGAEEYKYRLGAKDREFVHLSWFSLGARGKYLRRRVRLEDDLMRRVHEKFSAAGKGKDEARKEG